MKQITDDEWLEKYEPYDDENGTLIDYDPRVIKGDTFLEKELSNAIETNRIWTLVDEDGHLWMVSGWRIVNALSYHITEKPWQEELEVDWES